MLACGCCWTELRRVFDWIVSFSEPVCMGITQKGSLNDCDKITCGTLM